MIFELLFAFSALAVTAQINTIDSAKPNVHLGKIGKLVGSKKIEAFVEKNTIIAEVTNLEEFKKLPVVRFINALQHHGKCFAFAEVTNDQLMHILEQPFVIKVRIAQQ